MKKLIVLTVALVALTAGSAFALIASSAHDFTGTAWTNDICAPCHTPHNAIAGAGPLWAHSTSAATFAMYNSAFSSTIEATVGAQPTGISLACLSCHDGVTQVDAFIGNAGSTTIGAVAANLGTNLQNDHPIELTITDALFQIDTVANITAAGLPLSGGTMLTCATCHDVHAGTAFTSMLRVTPVGSAICLECHEK